MVVEKKTGEAVEFIQEMKKNMFYSDMGLWDSGAKFGFMYLWIYEEESGKGR